MPIGALAKIARGARPNVNRLQDEKGNFIAPGRLLRHLPRCAYSTALRALTGRRPALPWIAYDAIDEVRRFLSPAHHVLEYGSGMSTIWFASRTKHVVSVESDATWFAAVGALLQERSHTNVERLLISGPAYATAVAARMFDLILIDGDYRAECAEHAVSMVKPGGLIYLDNSDKHWDTPGGDLRRAEASLLQFAARRGAAVCYFTDLSPTQLFVQQGMMLHIPR